MGRVQNQGESSRTSRPAFRVMWPTPCLREDRCWGHSFSILNSCPSKSHHCSVFFRRSGVQQVCDAPSGALVRLRRLCFMHRRIFSRVRRELVTTSFASVRCNFRESERIDDQHTVATDRWDTSACTGVHANKAGAQGLCLHYGHEWGRRAFGSGGGCFVFFVKCLFVVVYGSIGE
ncbi:MAG: hypothetical protein RLZZ232_1294 [Planctomycetota bacterium]|jgi:hypothetical protein